MRRRDRMRDVTVDREVRQRRRRGMCGKTKRQKHKMEKKREKGTWPKYKPFHKMKGNEEKKCCTQPLYLS